MYVYNIIIMQIFIEWYMLRVSVFDKSLKL